MLIKKGAEANLYLEDWQGYEVIMKRRFPKSYRLPELDALIRAQRTLHEPQLMQRAKESGVPTPTIFMIDPKEGNIVMEYVKGKQVKLVLNHLSNSRRQYICRQIGILIGRLHRNGIIHGDLTTSNILLTRYSRLFLIDFGLGEYSQEMEARGVDLHLMRQAPQSTHYKYSKKCFDAVIEGYLEIMGGETTRKILEKVSQIERRGRYVAERGGAQARRNMISLQRTK